jgi:hypothetical protein
MKITELKVGTLVQDTWYPDWGTGIVDNVLDTRVFINFPYPKGFMKYDAAHTQFLNKGKSFAS